MKSETKPEKIKLEGGPLHGMLVPRPKTNHATIIGRFTRTKDVDGAPLEEPMLLRSFYQFWVEHDCAFFDSNAPA